MILVSGERFIDSLLKSSSYSDSVCECRRPLPFVTISRQAGAGGVTIAELLSARLNEQDRRAEYPWPVFDSKLVNKVLEEHHLPERIIPYLREDTLSEIEDTLDTLFGLHPAQFSLVRQVSETVLHLAHLGNVILVGRGSNVITRKLQGGFHVRLIASPENRICHLVKHHGFEPKAAKHFIASADHGRENYLKTFFNKEINDPLLYDLVINTDNVSYEEAADLITSTILSRQSKKRDTHHCAS